MAVCLRKTCTRWREVSTTKTRPSTLRTNRTLGQATTEFPFDKFGMTRPKVRLVLSVEDRIRLRIDFRLVKSNR